MLEKFRSALSIALFAVICVAPVAMAGTGFTNWSVQQVVTAPGGRVNYYILQPPSSGGHQSEIVEGLDGNRTTKILVAPHPSEKPASNLTGFSSLTLSPGARTLYFETSAWATEDAIHAMDLRTGKISLVTSGEISCVVLTGQYEGDLVVQQHRYFIEGGSYDPLELYSPAGKRLGLVALGPISIDSCRTLGS